MIAKQHPLSRHSYPPILSLSHSQTVVKQTPDNAGSAALLGEALFWSGRLAEAVGAFERARALAPGYEPVIFRLACVYADQERYAEALALLQRVQVAGYPEIDLASVHRTIARLRQIMQQAQLPGGR